MRYLIFYLALCCALVAQTTKVGGSGKSKVGGSGKTKVGAVTAGGPPAANVLNWPLNETSGTTITATTGPNGTTDGTWSTGLVLNGTSQEAQSNSTIAYAVQTATLAAWINCSWASIASGEHMIWENGSDAGGGIPGTFNAFIDISNGIIQIYLNDNTTHVAIKSIAIPSSGQHHIALGYSNATGVISAWIDGSPVTVSNVFSNWADAGNLATSTLNLGSRNAASKWLAGTFRNLRIWNTILSDADVLAVYTAGPT